MDWVSLNKRAQAKQPTTPTPMHTTKKETVSQ